MMETPVSGTRSRHLPQDLLPDILRRLPVKTLLRFRCVSKPWHSLVDNDADFASLHLYTFKNNRDQTRLFVVEGEKRDCSVRCAETFEPVPSQIQLSLSFYEAKSTKWWDIVSSVDGLVLLQLGNVLKLWNPSLRKFRELPPAPTMALAMKTKVIGLGYDPMDKDYKIVTLIYDFGSASDALPSVGIYTVWDGEWKIIPFRSDGSSRFGKDMWINGSVYLRGSLYFLIIEGERNLLWSFDLSNKVFSHISLPSDNTYHLSLKVIKLVLVDGGSSVAIYDYVNKSIWELERETMSWMKQSLWSGRNTDILYCKKNGDMLTSTTDLLYCQESSVTDVALYRHGKHAHRILRESRTWISHVSTYVESLFLIRS